MANNNRQVAFLFDEAGEMSNRRLGGKAMSLVTMTKLGMPVPAGFAVSTGICRAYLEHSRYPRRLQGQIERCLSILGRRSGMRFGDSQNPLLVSVRSGAPVSMPGMMDSILNLGITERSLGTLEYRYGKKFAHDTFDRFQASFKKVVGSTSDDPQEQLQLAFEAICQSWLNERAVQYRRAHDIPENLGTAMIVQSMVFGNLDCQSGTGVLFSRNVATGDREIYGEFLPEAQGEDVVGGSVTPLPISVFAKFHPQAFDCLVELARTLEQQEKDVIEIEFTVESGKLWTLQYRVAKRTPIAAARFAVQSVWEKRITKAEAITRLSDGEIEKVSRKEFDSQSVEQAKQGSRFFLEGLATSPGAAIGIVAFSSERAQQLVKEGKKAILFRAETNPDDFAGMLASSAIVTSNGGITCHAAVVARAMGKPVVVGVGEFPQALVEDEEVSVDGSRGVVSSGRITFGSGVHHKEVSIFLKWYDEHRPKGRVDFSSIEGLFSGNIVLNDFYLTEAMTKATAGTELESVAKSLRNKIHRESAEILSAYLLLAIAGELRHGWDSFNQWRSQEFELLETEFKLPRDKQTHCFRKEVQETVVRKLSEMDQKRQVRFLSLAATAFRSWSSGSYGGKAWAMIAEAVLGYLEGKLTHTVFVDRVFDLRHNGGHLFDKHPMFSDKTLEIMIRRNLDIKLKSETINELVSGWTGGLGSYSRFLTEGLSSEVAILWRNGLGKFWNEPKVIR